MSSKRLLLIFGLALLSLILGGAVLGRTRSATATTGVAPVYAQSADESADEVWNDIRDKIGDVFIDIQCETNLSCWLRNSSVGVSNAGLYTAMGTDSEEIAQADSFREAFPNGYGLLGTTGTLLAGVYSNPSGIHLATFFKRQFGNNLLTSPAYATAGTDTLYPIYGAWRGVRNLAYAAFVVVMGVVSLMIILRRQVAPRVIVTVTDALPKILFSLVLITLSYPIAALFIDLFVVWLPAVLTRAGVMTFGEVLTGGNIAIDWAADLVERFDQTGLVGFLSDFGMQFAAVILRAVTLMPIAGGALILIMLLFVLAAIIVLLFVIFQLLYRYTRIIIATVLGPLFLLAGSLPGNEGITMSWFKELAIHTLVFPAILFVIYLSLVILVSALSYTFPTIIFFSGIPDVGVIFVGVQAIVLPIISLIILLVGAFKVPAMIENALRGAKIF